MKFRENDPLTLEVLNDRLRYEPDTGLFRWNYERSYRAKKDAVAGYTREDGYARIRINGLEYFAHRVAWFVTYGKWPEAEIDHINGVKDDNRISNLREADRILNLQNLKKARRDNLSTGLLGAYAYQKGFTSYIQVNKERIYLGWFKTADEAHQAYMTAKRQLHPAENRRQRRLLQMPRRRTHQRLRTVHRRKHRHYRSTGYDLRGRRSV